MHGFGFIDFERFSVLCLVVVVKCFVFSLMPLILVLDSLRVILIINQDNRI